MEDSGVVLEMPLAGGSVLRPADIAYLFEPYRALFAKRHWNFVTRNFPTLSSGGSGAAIISVPTIAENHQYTCLVRTPFGYSTLQLNADDVENEWANGKLPSVADGIRVSAQRP